MMPPSCIAQEGQALQIMPKSRFLRKQESGFLLAGGSTRTDHS
jgi:hypothetical protein